VTDTPTAPFSTRVSFDTDQSSFSATRACGIPASSRSWRSSARSRRRLIDGPASPLRCFGSTIGLSAEPSEERLLGNGFASVIGVVDSLGPRAAAGSEWSVCMIRQACGQLHAAIGNINQQAQEGQTSSLSAGSGPTVPVPAVPASGEGRPGPGELSGGDPATAADEPGPVGRPTGPPAGRPRRDRSNGGRPGPTPRRCSDRRRPVFRCARRPAGRRRRRRPGPSSSPRPRSPRWTPAASAKASASGCPARVSMSPVDCPGWTV